MLIKEFRWDLEASDELRRARILILGQIIRATSFGLIPSFQDMLNRPLDYSRKELVEIYEGLEGTRNQNTLHLAQLQKFFSQRGIEIPKFVIDRAKDTSRGLEIWMCTIGAGISPDKRDEVREIWSLLSRAFPSLPIAMKSLVADDQKNAEIFGVQPESVWEGLSGQQIHDACMFIPSSFTKSLEK